MDIELKVKSLIESEITNLGYHLDSVVYETENNMNFLRVFIDKEGSVDIEDCVKVSKLINPILDEADLIAENYVLDVCSKEKGSE